MVYGCYLHLCLMIFTITGLLNWSQKLSFSNGVYRFSKAFFFFLEFFYNRKFLDFFSKLQSLKITLQRCFLSHYYLLCLSWPSQSGCKFSLEEERVVIELQAQFGNRWAKIASYLAGRTDNDVKNFWSSRQKRLARILQTSATTAKSQKNRAKVPTVLDVPTPEVIRWRGSSIPCFIVLSLCFLLL